MSTAKVPLCLKYVEYGIGLAESVVVTERGGDYEGL
jgi:hypothetical protein